MSDGEWATEKRHKRMVVECGFGRIEGGKICFRGIHIHIPYLKMYPKIVKCIFNA